MTTGEEDRAARPVRTTSDMVRLARLAAASVARETLKTAVLLALLLASVWLVVEVLRGGAVTEVAWHERLWRTFADAVRDVDGLPIAPRFFSAAGRSLAMVLASAAALGALSLAMGSAFALHPWLSLFRFPLLIASAVPAFMFPFLGVPTESSWFWPSVCLAVGDLNLAALVAHCYEAVRRELNLPYVRTARALGLSPWSDLWPRAVLIAIEGVRARAPHLLGGTVAVEYAFNIHGVGHMALDAVLNRRPDYNVLVWIAGLGIVATRVISVAQTIARALLTPDRGQSAFALDDGLSFGLAALWRAAGQKGVRDWRLEREVSARSPATNHPQVVPGRLARWRQRWRAYVRASVLNQIKLSFAAAIASAGLVLAAVIVWGGGYTLLDTDVSFQPATPAHPFGTNEMGEDVLSNVALGGRELLTPLAAALGVAVVLGGFFGVWSGLCRGSMIDAAFDLYAELWESVPKLIVVLAAITYMSYEHYSLKVYVLLGLAFAPLVFRAVRDEVGAMRASLFLESSVVLGVSRWRIFWTHVLRNHALPVLCVHGAAMIGYCLLFDAILGSCGVRQYGEVFSWGSMIGAELDGLAERLDAGLPTNALTVWGPLAAMLTAITCSVVAGDALKSLGRSVRFSQ